MAANVRPPLTLKHVQCLFLQLPLLPTMVALSSHRPAFPFTSHVKSIQLEDSNVFVYVTTLPIHFQFNSIHYRVLIVFSNLRCR